MCCIPSTGTASSTHGRRPYDGPRASSLNPCVHTLVLGDGSRRVLLRAGVKNRVATTRPKAIPHTNRPLAKTVNSQRERGNVLWNDQLRHCCGA